LPLVVNPDHVLFAGPGRGLGPRRGIPFQILEDWKHKRGCVFRTIDGGTTWMRLADFNASE